MNSNDAKNTLGLSKGSGIRKNGGAVGRAIWATGAALAISLGMLLASCTGARPEAVGKVTPAELASPTAHFDQMRTHMVLTGQDVLEREGFERLKGRKIGLIANHSALDRDGRHILDTMLEHPEVQLVALFSPEHGFRGTKDDKVESGKDAKTGLPIYSLYGKTERPNDEMLKGIDTLVFNIQDIGARFYTYNATMGACMEEAAKRGIRFMVLDRPNPIGGWWFDGPIQDADLVGKHTSFLPMTIAHGMTLGELAVLYNTHYGIGVELEVVKMEGWHRDMFGDETGLPWVNPSPNMRSLDEEILYTMVCLTENPGTGISVGRWTDRPFEQFGAPWVKGEALAENLQSRKLPGLCFMPIVFIPPTTTPTGDKVDKYPHAGQTCNGVRVVITDRWKVSPVEAGIHMIDALYRLHPEQYKLDPIRGLVGATWVVEALKKGEKPEAIVARWRESSEFKQFAAAREKALLYGYRKF